VGITELLKRKHLLENQSVETLRQKNQTQTRILELERLQLRLEEILDSIDEEQLSIDLVKLHTVNNQMIIVKNEIDKLIIKNDSLIQRLAHLNSHKYNPNCKICMENSTSIIASKESAKLELQRQNKLLESYNNEKLRLDNKLLELKNIEETDIILKDTQSKEIQVERELSNLINKIATYETAEAKNESQLYTQTKLIEEYYKNEAQINKNKIVRGQLSVIRNSLVATKEHERKLNKIILSLNGTYSGLKSQIQTIKDRIQEVKDLEQQTNLFKYYLNALSKDGVSYELIEKALPMIEGEVNNILAQIVEFGIQFEIDGKNINANLVYGDQKWSLEMSSGMERFVSGLAIRVALINICNLPRPNFLIIDEGFGTLDSENMQSLYRLFIYLKTQFEFVMIISHIDTMRDAVDNLVEIKKENGFSHVKF